MSDSSNVIQFRKREAADNETGYCKRAKHTAADLTDDLGTSVAEGGGADNLQRAMHHVEALERIADGDDTGVVAAIEARARYRSARRRKKLNGASKSGDDPSSSGDRLQRIIDESRAAAERLASGRPPTNN